MTLFLVNSSILGFCVFVENKLIITEMNFNLFGCFCEIEESSLDFKSSWKLRLGEDPNL